MSGLLVVGAGGHGKVVADAAMSMGVWDRIAFVDDRWPELQTSLGLQVVGSIRELSTLVQEFPSLVVAIGNASTRLELISRCQQYGFELPVIAHRLCAVSSFASLGPGSVVFAQAAVNADARLGVGCIVNTGATIDHDCVLGDGVHICPGANLAGNVRVGDRAWIGIGACVKQGISIGADVTVGAGAVVVSDIEAGLTVMGVPARPKDQCS